MVRVHDCEDRKRDEELAIPACCDPALAASPVPEIIDHLEHEFE
jgi:hypothetical protein